ncbi:hypothetical protein CYMTET_28214 [Cymbomonas tetramitiformis]|uniref:Uncharacterized protein n=1 Tax=Cymbomonas tetramitiformis TaxID=36881 RepID=A0AAE0FNF9_9CHLO|nr:hypothetical protein CYMTET_28214 [Cymbomonas tetramitiformis]
MANILRELVEKGVEVGAEDGEGRTALTLALAFGQEAAARALLEAGAGVNAVTGRRPLHAVAERGMVEMVRELMEKGAEVDAEGRQGCTALKVALAGGREAAARVLLEAGAGVNAGTGQRPAPRGGREGHGGDGEGAYGEGGGTLHAAVERGMEEMVRELVAKGAEVDAEDGEGRTALTLALAGGKEAAARALLEAGASVGKAGRGGFCVLDLFLSALLRTAMLAVLPGPAAGKLDGSALVFPSPGFQTFGCTFACKAPSRRVYYELVILKLLNAPRFGFVDASFELSSASGGSGVDVSDFTLGVFPAFTASSGAVSVHMLACEMRHMPPDHIAFGDECYLANVAQLDACDLRVVEILAGRLAGRHSHCTLRLAATLGLSDITRLLLENGAASADAAGPAHGGDNRRRINVYGSAPDAAETENRGAGERHAARRGADGQAMTTTAADDNPPLGRPAVGSAGVTGPERQRTTGKRRRSRASGDALGGDVDGRGVDVDVQRMVDGGTGERHAAVGDVDELELAEGQAKNPSMDEQHPAGGGMDELDTRFMDRGRRWIRGEDGAAV